MKNKKTKKIKKMNIQKQYHLLPDTTTLHPNLNTVLRKHSEILKTAQKIVKFFAENQIMA